MVPAGCFLWSHGGPVCRAQLPVRGVIVLEPYADVLDVIHRAPASDLFGHRWLARWIRPHEMDEAIARTDDALDVDLSRIDPLAALARTQVCTLILGGEDDTLIPPATLRDRRCGRPGRASLKLPPKAISPCRCAPTACCGPCKNGWMPCLRAAPDGDCLDDVSLSATLESG